MQMADDWVRLGMALAVIALVSVGMYSFSGHANGASPYKGTSAALRP
jgi:hypothetical protein